MKIAYIGLKGSSSKYGGIETFAQQIALRLSQKGHQVTIYPQREKKEPELRSTRIDMVFASRTKLNSVRSLIHAFISCFDAISKRYDIIHLHGYMSYFLIPFIKIFGKITVVTLHGAAWKNISYTKFERKIIRLAMLIGVNLSDRVTTVSLPLKKELERYHNIRILLTPVGTYRKNQIPPKQIRLKYKLNPNKYILYLGRLEKVKRVHWIIMAFRHTNPSINLVIAGDSQDQDYKNYLQELSNRDKRIIFTGFVDGRLKEELLSNCLFFVLPSFVEGMPVALLEAMGHGRVCLASDISAHKWIIQDHETGILFNRDRFEDFIFKIRNIITMPPQTLSNIGTDAARYVETNFKWNHTTALLEDLYFQLVKEKNDYARRS